MKRPTKYCPQGSPQGVYRSAGSLMIRAHQTLPLVKQPFT